MKTSLPEAVQRQADELEAMDKEIEAAAPITPDPELPPAPPSPEPEPPPAPAADAAAEWEQRYRTLQGMFNAQAEQLKALTAEIASLKTQPAQPPAQQPPAEPAPKLITEQEVETFGADLVDLIRRAALEVNADVKATLQAQIDDVKSKLPTLQKDVETVRESVTTDRRETYWSDLAKLVPTYEAINASQPFKDWLLGKDDFSGMVRDAILQDAFNAFNAEQTAKVFQAFQKATGQAAPPPPPADPPSPPPPGAELAEQVSPSGSRTPAHIDPTDDKKLWTQDEMSAFYSGITRGDYRGREAEAQRIDAAIDKALAEGRVR